MRLSSVALACALIPATAAADREVPAPAGDATEQVIGGTKAVAGKWPDVAAILFPVGPDEQAQCTGTLVAPTVVLTAGHCYDVQSFPVPDSVLIGASSLARPEDGETIAIKLGVAFPDAVDSEDVTVLVLATPSSRPPRPIATGWAHFDVVNGAPISLVGFGAIDRDAMTFVQDLQEARSTVTDFDCSRSPGCNTLARPAGELGAGGMGVDTCPGDSGGPLYLTTSYGVFLAGVTSRSYSNARFMCSEGGIYERPDKIIDWIEATAGVPVARGPAPAADPIVAVRGDSGDTMIHANDPRSSVHRFAITAPPAHGAAKVRSDGTVRVCTDPVATASDDQLTVTVTDILHAGRAVAVTIPIQIEDGTPPAVACNLDNFANEGCCDSGGQGAGGAIPLTIGVLALVMRRRR